MVRRIDFDHANVVEEMTKQGWFRIARRWHIAHEMENALANALGPEATQLAATEKHDLLARLLKRLAHEIRNPLSSLDVHFQLLEEDLSALAPSATTQLRSRMGIIHGELHRLETIVERFLSLAAPSALKLEAVEPGKIVAHVCALLRPDASNHHVELLAEVQPDLPVVRLDSVRLTQALLNVTINGIQAVNGQGQVRVTATAAGPSLLLRVQDTGPGIPPENIGDVFDPYFTTKTEGCGLGLWIAQQIAVAHGGTLAAENAPGGGAMFTLALPIQRQD